MSAIYNFDDHPDGKLWIRLCERSRQLYNYETTWHPADRLSATVEHYSGLIVYDSSQKIVAIQFETEEDLLAFILKI